MIGSDDMVRVKIVIYGINSKMADLSLTSLLLAAPHIYIYIYIYTVMRRLTTFRATTDRIYDGSASSEKKKKKK